MAQPQRRVTGLVMKAYLGRVGYSGLQGFFVEDVIPGSLLPELIHEWTCPTTSIIRTIVAEDGAEESRWQLVDDHYDVAANLLLNRAIEILALNPNVWEYPAP